MPSVRRADTAACTALLGEHAAASRPIVLDPWPASVGLVHLPQIAREAMALMATTSNSGRVRRPGLAGAAVDRPASPSGREHS